MARNAALPILTAEPGLARARRIAELKLKMVERQI